MNLNSNLQLLITDIVQIIEQARGQVRQSINTAMVESYWQIGRLIVDHEQNGEARAEYGKQQLQFLSTQLIGQFGKGFDVTNLRIMWRFYLAFPIRDALRLELGWTHYRSLIRIENPAARKWYQQEAISQSWSARALERQIGVLYYERLLASKDKTVVEQEAKRRCDDNPTIGLILCTEHNHTVAKYSVLNDSKQLFASKYLLELPSEEELKRELERERAIALARLNG